MQKTYKTLQGFTLPVLLLILIFWMLLCTHIAGLIPVKEIVSRISTPVIVFMATAALLSICPGRGRTVLFIILGIFAVFEATVGVMQLLDKYPANNPYFKLTGNFVNQGLFGGMMSLSATACLYAFIHWKNTVTRTAVGIVFAVSFTMMIMSVSRAAWMGFIVAGIVILYSETKCRIDFSRKRNLVAVIVAAVAVCALIYIIKPQSALVRLHMWRMDLRAIVEHPLTGVGSGAEVGAYGDAQEHFFAAKDRLPAVKQIADCPQFVFNEFLKFGMQGGIPGLMLALAIYTLALVSLLRKKSVNAYILVSLGVFSLFSFPLFSITFRCILAVLLADACVVNEGKGRWLLAAAGVAAICLMLPYSAHQVKVMQLRKEWRFSTDGPRRFGKYYPDLKYDSEFVNIYADFLNKSGYYPQTIKVLEEGMYHFSGAVHLCLLGSCYQSVGELDNAQKLFRRAMNRAPKRMTPYFMMVNYYNSLGFKPLARAYQKKALAMPYDTTQTETVKMRKLIESFNLEEKE